MVLPFAVDQVERDVRDALPTVLRGDAAFGEQDMQMRVVDARSSSGLQNDDGADIEINAFRARFQDLAQAGVTGSHERGKQDVRIAIEPSAEKFWDGQDNMAVNNAGQHASANEIRPLFGMHLGAGEAKGGLATEGNAVGFTAMGAAVLREPHLLWVAAAEHFLDDFIVVPSAVVRAVRRRECVPVVTEDLFEGVLVDAGFHSQVS